MPEVEYAKQTQRFVQLLLDLGVTNPWFYRMMIGRLYYAAHHLARRLLVEAGLQPDQWRGAVHRQTIDGLQTHYVTTGRLTTSALDGLDELRDLRNRVDHRLDCAVRLRNVNCALTLFHRFARETWAILGVS